jgi:hypothetical protein
MTTISGVFAHRISQYWCGKRRYIRANERVRESATECRLQFGLDRVAKGRYGSIGRREVERGGEISGCWRAPDTPNRVSMKRESDVHTNVSEFASAASERRHDDQTRGCRQKLPGA